jgi:hypothetical protein
LIGGVAKWQCTGLQSWLSWFDSNTRLQFFCCEESSMDHHVRSPITLLAGSLLSLGLSILPAAAAVTSPNNSNYNYYVAPEGSDSNMGTKTSPFKTIQRASNMSMPGTTIHVAAGTYVGGFKTSVSGEAGARIVYLSTTRWGAKIVPPSNSRTNVAWDNRGSYVDIVGFDIDGGGAYAGMKWLNGIYNGGSYGSIRGNHVHHIGEMATCTNISISGIGVDSYYRGVGSEVIGNNVHDIAPPGCKYGKGIYLNTSGEIKNNIVYNIGGAAIQLWHDANKVVIANNTVTNSSSGIVVGGGEYYYTKGPNDYTSVLSNIVYDNKYGITEQGATGKNNSYRNNLVFQNVMSNWDLRNGLEHSGTVTAPPQFVKYAKAGTPDFHLLSSSPAIGKGLPDHAHEADFEGKPRRKSTGFDIGAYQR